jgi:2-(1,2-epoxy-1,2-dihydrophenyl)acetyl-CoA isomerase
VHVVLTERQESVLLVTLNRPERLNALDAELLDALAATWDDARDPAVRAVVVTGAGRGFCAGADLRQPTDGGVRAGGLRRSMNPIMLAMCALEKPILAAINGPAAGAGLALALAADIRIASTAARFVPSFARIGVVPDNGGSWFAVRALGYSAAFAWLASGREMLAAEALERGVVNQVTEPGQLLAVTIAQAEELAAMPGRAVGLTKLLLSEAVGSSLAHQLEAEARYQELAFTDPERERARAQVVTTISSPASQRGEPATTDPAAGPPGS